MKWPETLTIVRHGESMYNALKQAKEADPRYKEFKKAYNKREKDPETAKELALQLIADRTFMLDFGDHDTPLSEKGHQQAETTGAKLSEKIKLPDVVFVSPYLRTRQTLGSMAVGWPELGEVKIVEEERIREQEHGLALIYNDWRIFNIMHPEQDQLRGLQGSYWYQFPQGESVPQVRERDRSFKNTVTRDYREQNVLVVAHHLQILAARANQERFGADEFIRLDHEEKPVNCGVTIYRGDPDLGQDGRLILDTYNEQLY